MFQLPGLQGLRPSSCSLNSPSDQGSFSSDYIHLEMQLSSLSFLTFSALVVPSTLTSVLCYVGAAVAATVAQVPTAMVPSPFCAAEAAVAGDWTPVAAPLLQTSTVVVPLCCFLLNPLTGQLHLCHSSGSLRSRPCLCGWKAVPVALPSKQPVTLPLPQLGMVVLWPLYALVHHFPDAELSLLLWFPALTSGKKKPFWKSLLLSLILEQSRKQPGDSPNRITR